jgi:uncharacterized protein (TIGR02246 family)
MNLRISILICRALACGAALMGAAASVRAQNAETAAIRAADEQLVKAFDAGKADEVAALFLPQGELIDENGAVYQGQAAIKELLTKFFEKFSGAKLTLEIESVRIVGPVAIEEGTRHTTTKEGVERAQVRFIAVRARVGNAWPLVSVRDFSDESATTPHELLQPLAWLVGQWVNESSDAAVKITYRWSEDKNFLLGDFHITKAGELIMKSEQRIAWDPLTGKIRSWMFDSDGGYADQSWTQVEDAWVIKSAAVMPDGLTGSATVTVLPQGNDRFVMKGTERIVGDARDDDFEVTVVRPAPKPGNKSGN